MANMFNEDGTYNKTEWKPGDRITASKLNKIEESLEAINNNDITRHVEADARLDALENNKELVDEKLEELEDMAADYKVDVDVAIYEINSTAQRLEKEMNEGIDEVHAVAETVDGKIAAADASMKAQVNQGKADMEAMVDEVEGELEGLNEQIEQNEKLNLNYSGIGEMQNIDESRYVYPNRLDFGNLSDAPVAKRNASKGFDIIGHWYNDFGLEYTASSQNEANGWHGWYDWRWNFTSTENYDAKRHPLLGFYKGDDPIVLDWICYWLIESGINVVSLTQSNGFSRKNWTSSDNLHFWEYQLLNNVKNFKSMKYILSSKTGGSASIADIEEQNDEIVQTYSEYNNVYLYKKNNKNYATVFIWDLESVRGVYDNYNGVVNTTDYLINYANKMKNIGYDGICILARNSGIDLYNLSDLEKNDVILLNAGYESTQGNVNDYTTYENYAKNCTFPVNKNSVVNVVTSLDSHPTHTSNFNLKGSTPYLFGHLLNRAIDFIEKNKMSKLITIYNVSEWAEGGAGLIPNLYDGFGYLDAVKGCKTINGENLDIDSILSYLSKNNKDFYVTKSNKLTVGAGINRVVEFNDLAFKYNYNDNPADYVFLLSVESSVNNDKNVCELKCYATPKFSEGRMYATIYNPTTTDISNVYINLIIKKIVN